MECSSCRGMKLLKLAMKMVERILEHRIRQQIEIDDMQFGLMTSKGTIDAIFVLRQMQQKFQLKSKRFHFGFLDLAKRLIGY